LKKEELKRFSNYEHALTLIACSPKNGAIAVIEPLIASEPKTYHTKASAVFGSFQKLVD
jgi:hypothetical protein